MFTGVGQSQMSCPVRASRDTSLRPSIRHRSYRGLSSEIDRWPTVEAGCPRSQTVDSFAVIIKPRLVLWTGRCPAPLASHLNPPAAIYSVLPAARDFANGRRPVITVFAVPMRSGTAMTVCRVLEKMARTDRWRLVVHEKPTQRLTRSEPVWLPSMRCGTNGSDVVGDTP